SQAQANRTTVGILLQPRSDGRRPWDTTAGMVVGVASIDADERRVAERLWRTIDEGAQSAEGTDSDDPFGRASRD
ncbi:MAG: hypothetical protein M3P18_08475, partial [Actinomycetota bacterium]|nr:hypothetical protein [Actinomycetota bacterium]